MLSLLAFGFFAILQGSESTSTTICEGNSGTLTCSGPMTITDASYGRHDGSTCGGPVLTTSCHASTSLSVVRSACDGQTSCSVSSSNSVFGDPCQGTYKYLTVTWTCAVNGNWGSWGSYGSCSVTCGGGTQSRNRVCNDPAPSNGGSDCSGSSSSTQACNTQSCPVDGNWGSWGSYGSCSVTCGGGTQSRNRVCNDPAPSNGGSDCSGSSSSTQACNTQSCPVDGNWGSWGSYGSCSVTCGGGTQSRNRACNDPAPANGGVDCPGSSSSSQTCNTQNCPVDGNWGSWGSYDSCSVTCGGGTQSRNRVCDDPAPLYGGSDCSGSSSSSQACSTQNCPVDGNWGSWGSYDSCSVTCGGGTQSRNRVCDDPAPLYGGSDCPGSSSSSQTCNTQNCPVDGNWGSWGSYGSCSVTCGGGTQSRDRSCDNPAPAHGGSSCSGSSSSTQACNTQNCPIDGSLGSWGAWGSCTVTCGGGTQEKTRACDSPTPQYGGALCTGATSATQDCNTQVCIIDGSWGNWSPWGTCTVTCGSGTASRSRTCNNPAPANGGLDCSGPSGDFGSCDKPACTTPAPGTYQQLCPTGWFTCMSGSLTCIDASFRCDCSADCDDGSDESQQYAGCTALCENGVPGVHRFPMVLTIICILTSMLHFM